MDRFISSKHIGKVKLLPYRTYMQSGLVIDYDPACDDIACDSELRIDWFRLPRVHQE
ncbi:hypothetical protein HDU79_001992, partial [Rhizoclosmatium sp. JEL0117]